METIAALECDRVAALPRGQTNDSVYAELEERAVAVMVMDWLLPPWTGTD